MIISALVAVFIAILLVLVRAIIGPGIFNRILAANIIGTQIVIAIALIGQWQQSFFLVDIALIYALINFITTIGLLRYIQHQLSHSQ
jgi:multicomponent Na+:H+ antiporter subunit F